MVVVVVEFEDLLADVGVVADVVEVIVVEVVIVVVVGVAVEVELDVVIVEEQVASSVGSTKLVLIQTLEQLTNFMV